MNGKKRQLRTSSSQKAVGGLKRFTVFEVLVFLLVIGTVIIMPLLSNNESTPKETAIGPKAEQAKKKRSKEVNLPPIERGVVLSDVPYCNGQALDIYQPRTLLYERSPIVMYIHGGGWRINDKASEPNQLAMIDGLRDKGFAVVSIDYRKMPDFYFPSPVEDALCAVRFLRANDDKYYLDTDKIAIYGFSAGGHLAAMIGTLSSDNQFNNGQYKDESSRVQAVVSLAGVLVFDQGLYERNQKLVDMFLQGADVQTAHPGTYVSGDDPSFLLIHGDQDMNVPVEQDELFAQKLEQHGVKFERIVVQNGEHGLGEAGGVMAPSREEVKQRMHEFIRRELGVEQ